MKDIQCVRKTRWAMLLALCIAFPLGEMAALTATLQRGAFPLSPQITAPPPLGIFHDLRWLFVYHSSWGSFVWELATLLSFRTLLSAAIIRTAWPEGSAAPGWKDLFTRALAFNCVAVVVLSPFLLLLFAAAATALAWPWFACMIPVCAFALVMHQLLLTGNWKLLPTLRSCGWVVLDWLVLTLAGAALELVPVWVAFVLVAIFGAFNAMIWRALARIFCNKTKPAFKLFAPAASILVYAGLLVAFYLFLSGGRSKPEPAATASVNSVVADSGKPAVLVVEGLGTSWSGGPIAEFGKQFTEVRFSYRGLNAQDEPLPYTPADTRERLHDVVRMLDTQVRALAARSGQPIRIVCASEGALATQIYLATHPEAPVTQVIISSPEIASAQVYFPPEGESGWGRVAGLGIHGWLRLFKLFGWERPSQLPVLRSMLDYGPIISRIDRCPMGDFNESVLMPLSSTLVMPWDVSTALPTYLVETTHGHIIVQKAGNAAVRTLLTGEKPDIPLWRTVVGWAGRSLGSAWRVPPLAPRLPTSWQHLVVGTARLDGPMTRRLIRRTFGPAVSVMNSDHLAPAHVR